METLFAHLHISDQLNSTEKAHCFWTEEKAKYFCRVFKDKKNILGRTKHLNVDLFKNFRSIAVVLHKIQ